MVGCHSAVRLQYRYDCCAFLLPGAVDLTSMRHVAKNRPQELLLSVQTSKKWTTNVALAVPIFCAAVRRDLGTR